MANLNPVPAGDLPDPSQQGVMTPVPDSDLPVAGPAAPPVAANDQAGEEQMPEFGPAMRDYTWSMPDVDLSKYKPGDFGKQLETEYPKRKLASQLAVAATMPKTVAGKMSAIAKLAPGTTFNTDDRGNVIVNYDGKRYMLNKPGLSGQDIMNAGALVLTQLPFMAIGGAAGKALLGDFVGRVLGVGTGAALGSLSQDVLGDEQPDLKGAALSAGTAGAFETFAPLVINRLGAMVRSSTYFNSATNQLTAAGKAVLANMGIDPQTATPELLNEFKKALSKTPDTNAAATYAENQSLPVAVPASRGDLLRTPDTQGLESAAERGGGFTVAATQRANALKAAKNTALNQNVEALQNQIGNPIPYPGAGMSIVQQQLADQQAQLKGLVDQAYQAARDKGTSVLNTSVDDMGQFIQKNFAAKYGLAAPTAGKLANQFSADNLLLDGETQGDTTTVQRLEEWRQNVSALARSSDPVEKGAARNLLSSYDDYINNIINKAAIQGDPDALQAFQDARSLRLQLAQQFESSKLLSDIVDTQNGSLVMTPQEALNTLFTANKLGAKQGSVTALQKIKGLLNNQPDAWNALRQEGFLRLLSNQRGPANQMLSSDFSGQKFATALDSALQNSRDLMTTLYTPDELQAMQTFKRVALRATTRVPGAINTSNTATVGGLLQKMGTVGGLLKNFLAEHGFPFPAEKQVMDQFNNPLPEATPAGHSITGPGQRLDPAVAARLVPAPVVSAGLQSNQ